MYKYFITLSVAFSFVVGLPAQEIIERRIVSDFFEQKEERLVKVWLPKISDSDSITNIVYVFDAHYCSDIAASIVGYFNKIKTVPPTAVVGVYYRNMDDRSDVGLDLENMTVNKYGEAFISYLRDEVRPMVEGMLKAKAYHNVYLGHSYLGDYGCYLLKNTPDLFDSYILIAPEQALAPVFETNALKDKRIFIASAKDDAPRRIKMANKFYNVLRMASENNHVEKVVFKDAGHLTVIPMAIDRGLTFIYRDFVSRGNLDRATKKTETIIENFERISSNNESNYKYGLENSAATTLDLFYGSKKPSLEEFDWLIAHTGGTNGNHHEIIGSLYHQLGAYDKAETYLFKSRELYIASRGQQWMQNVYRHLIELYTDRGDSLSAIDAMYEEAIRNMPRNIDWYYKRGIFSVNSGYQVEQGITSLQQYIDRYSESYIKYPLPEVYSKIAEGYFKLGQRDAAMQWTEKALGDDPKCKEAKQLFARITKTN